MSLLDLTMMLIRFALAAGLLIYLDHSYRKFIVYRVYQEVRAEIERRAYAYDGEDEQ